LNWALFYQKEPKVSSGSFENYFACRGRFVGI